MANFLDPYYDVTIQAGSRVRIDVTNSISASSGANAAISETIIPWLRSQGCRRVLDFGAGALRHTIPFLKSGFEVIAVEYKEAFDRPVANGRLSKYRDHGNLKIGRAHV